MFVGQHERHGQHGHCRGWPTARLAISHQPLVIFAISLLGTATLATAATKYWQGSNVTFYGRILDASYAVLWKLANSVATNSSMAVLSLAVGAVIIAVVRKSASIANTPSWWSNKKIMFKRKGQFHYLIAISSLLTSIIGQLKNKSNAYFMEDQHDRTCDLEYHPKLRPSRHSRRWVRCQDHVVEAVALASVHWKSFLLSALVGVGFAYKIVPSRTKPVTNLTSISNWLVTDSPSAKLVTLITLAFSLSLMLALNPTN